MINLTKLLTALAFVAGLCLSASAVAKDRPLGENLSPEGYPPVYVYTINPNREVGFHVGDVLQRIVILHVPKPYKLLETSLPLTNTQKLRQNKKQGIEVHSDKLEQDDNDRYNIYTLDITYQVFTISLKSSLFCSWIGCRTAAGICCRYRGSNNRFDSCWGIF